MTDIQTVGAEQASAPPPDSAPPSEATLDADLDKIWSEHEAAPRDEIGQPRDESGRWTKAEGETEDQPQEGETPPVEASEESPDAKEDSGDQSGEAPPEQAKPAIEAPQSWSKEAREHWAKIPSEAQQIIAQREREAHSQISQLGQSVKAVEPLLGVLEQNREMFARRGVSYEQGVASLLQAQRMLEQDPVSAIQTLAQHAGVDLAMFGNGNSEDGSQHRDDPRVLSLQNQLHAAQQQIASLGQKFQSVEEREQRAFFTTIEQEISAFQSEKQLDEATMEAMADRVAFYTQNHPEMSVRQRLDRAYEDMVWTDPNRRQAMIEREIAAKQEAAKKAADEKAEKAKKAAAVNVKSSPVKSQGKTSVDDELERIWAAHHS